MSLAVLASGTLIGLEMIAVRVEVHIAPGLPSFQVVGLPDAGVRESRERVRSAIVSSGFDFPAARITVNLAPADVPKESGRFDLPIALGVLLASGQISDATAVSGERLPVAVQDFVFAGELSLTGAVVPSGAALAFALGVQRHYAERILFYPCLSAKQAAHIPQLKVVGVSTLTETVALLSGQQAMQFAQPAPMTERAASTSCLCMSEVYGQQQARFALELAASGGHSLLMSGPPGVGKSMLAQRLPTLLPPLRTQQQLEVAVLKQLSGNATDALFTEQPPFRAPHHSCTMAAMVGGGRQLRPGEITLAHHGVLFMDELPEFDRRVLESLREPLETGEVVISRANQRGCFPARFQLIAAMNPCPCGYFGHPKIACRCTPEKIDRYRAKLSGPLLDRIDLYLVLPFEETFPTPHVAVEDSSTIRQRVQRCQQRQYQRQGMLNVSLQGETLDRYAALQPEALQLMENAMRKWAWSVRVVQRLRRVARTIADMQQSEHITAEHVALAMQFRDQSGLKY